MKSVRIPLEWQDEIEASQKKRDIPTLHAWMVWAIRKVLDNEAPGKTSVSKTGPVRIQVESDKPSQLPNGLPKVSHVKIPVPWSNLKKNKS